MRLFFEGKATHNLELIRYSLDYLNILRENEIVKVESLTRYFLENFEFMKKNLQDESNKKNKNNTGIEELDFCGEWSNKSNSEKLGFWINTDVKYRDTQTKFKQIPIQIITFAKILVNSQTIIRFYWNKNDIREFQKKEYTPYISISGIFHIDHLVYPKTSQTARNWKIRELVGNKYKYSLLENKESNLANHRNQYKIDLSPNIYIKDLENVLIGKYEEDKGSWSLIDNAMPDFLKDKKVIRFYSNEMANFSILLERRIFFPYKSWYLRTIDEKTAILDLESKK